MAPLPFIIMKIKPQIWKIGEEVYLEFEGYVLVLARLEDHVAIADEDSRSESEDRGQISGNY